MQRELPPCESLRLRLGSATATRMGSRGIHLEKQIARQGLR
jgi:hypothetical protein